MVSRRSNRTRTRARSRSGTGAPAPGDAPPESPPSSSSSAGGRGGGRRLRSHQVAAAIDAAVASCSAGVGRPATRLVEALAAGAGPGRPAAATEEGDDDGHRVVDRALARALVEAVTGAWRLGWQPVDLHRAVERQRGRSHAGVAVQAVAHEALRYRRDELPPRWRQQLDAIGAVVPDDDSGPASGAGAGAVASSPAGTGAWAVGGARSRPAAVAVAIETLAVLRLLPRLPKLGPGPGDQPAGRARPRSDGAGADPRVLHKVTSLLAKAESTSFPDEAEALTAKAQQLMTRHAIDHAMVAAGAAGRSGAGPGVGGRRVGIDDPYGGARFLLLTVVAEANRCRAVWSKYWGFATVFGEEGDLDAVELLYTSLLVQATRAMVAEAPSGPGGAGRTRSFRQSFLVAFARRIGARLQEAADAVTAAAAARSTALVPLLEARREAAAAAADEAFPKIGTTRMSANDAAGWHAGTRAASQAQLDMRGALRE